MPRYQHRRLIIEGLERRDLMAADLPLDADLAPQPVETNVEVGFAAPVVTPAGEGESHDTAQFPHMNPGIAEDVDGDGDRDLRDAFLIIDEFRKQGSTSLPVPPEAPFHTPATSDDNGGLYRDPSPNNRLDLVDVFRVIDMIRFDRLQTQGGLGEGALAPNPRIVTLPTPPPVQPTEALVNETIVPPQSIPTSLPSAAPINAESADEFFTNWSLGRNA